MARAEDEDEDITKEFRIYREPPTPLEWRRYKLMGEYPEYKNLIEHSIPFPPRPPPPPTTGQQMAFLKYYQNQNQLQNVANNTNDTPTMMLSPTGSQNNSPVNNLLGQNQLQEDSFSMF